MRRLIASALVALAALAVGGCGDDDDGSSTEEAETYAADVERLGDAAYEAGQDSLVALNEVADGSRSPAAASRVLERSAREVRTQSERLGSLAPPEEAAAVADDLEFQLDSLSRAIDGASADLSSFGNPADAARNGARVVLAAQSGTAALERALRMLAIEAGD